MDLIRQGSRAPELSYALTAGQPSNMIFLRILTSNFISNQEGRLMKIFLLILLSIMLSACSTTAENQPGNAIHSSHGYGSCPFCENEDNVDGLPLAKYNNPDSIKNAAQEYSIQQDKVGA